MSDVPWAPGRKALIRIGAQWMEAVGVADGFIAPNGSRWSAGWVVVSRAGTSTATTWYPPKAAPTASLPSQCCRCYLVGAHAFACMVAANLASGVPEFWSPWAMWVFPDEEAGHALYIGCGGNIERIYVSEGDGVWLLDGKPVEPGTTMESLGGGFDGQWLICLGPNGPTLAPWGK